MKGQPVWHASASRKNSLASRTVPTSLWSPRHVAEGIDLLRRLLGPAGNPARERHFRQPASINVHRATTDEEVQQLPAWFCEQPAINIAGGPLEILWESEPGNPSTQPCLHPTQRRGPGSSSPLMFVVGDCGQCDPCQARRVLETLMDVKRRALADQDRG